jgi:hypothetical protein
MPRLKVPEEAIWREFEIETKLIQPPILKLKIKPTFRKEIINQLYSSIELGIKDSTTRKEIIESFKNLAEYAKKLVIDWDLTDENEQPIACTEETKEKWLDPLLWEYVKAESGQENKWLWHEIIEIASDLSNFTKN